MYQSNLNTPYYIIYYYYPQQGNYYQQGNNNQNNIYNQQGIQQSNLLVSNNNSNKINDLTTRRLDPPNSLLRVPDSLPDSNIYKQPENYNYDQITYYDLYLNHHYRDLNNSKIYKHPEYKYIRYDPVSNSFVKVEGNETDVENLYNKQKNDQQIYLSDNGLIKWDNDSMQYKKVLSKN